MWSFIAWTFPRPQGFGLFGSDRRMHTDLKHSCAHRKDCGGDRDEIRSKVDTPGTLLDNRWNSGLLGGRPDPSPAIDQIAPESNECG